MVRECPSPKKKEGGKSGSRRIFSPVFKLQVLDSYRQDSDCQGNQRATARKYGIHRRQIQKWLQTEQNLRLSVQQAGALNLSKDNNHHKIIPKGGSEDDKSDSDEYINVDEVSDSDCSDSSGALDFTSATLSKRKYYDEEFKLRVLDAFKRDDSCKGNQRATARKFGIHRRQVQKWLNLDLEQNIIEHNVQQQGQVDECREVPQQRQEEGEMCLDLRKRKSPPPAIVPYKRTKAEIPGEETVAFECKESCEVPGYFVVHPEYPVYCQRYCCYQYFPREEFKYTESYPDLPLQYGFRHSTKWLAPIPTYEQPILLYR